MGSVINWSSQIIDVGLSLLLDFIKIIDLLPFHVFLMSLKSVSRKVKVEL